jgi:DNA topoisomerase VI subunit B
MRNLSRSAISDLVTSLTHECTPVCAVVELVWDANDAEADTVRIQLERTDMDAIERVTVEDDGHGISSNEVQATFARIGGSWKALASRSKNDRRDQHGTLGEGRLRACALGDRAKAN